LNILEFWRYRSVRDSLAQATTTASMVPSRTPMRLESSSLPIRTAPTDTLLD
jgi:hypothetical protein